MSAEIEGTPPSRADFEHVLTFWFGTLDELGRADTPHARRWWRSDPDFDREIRQRFGAEHDAVARGERDYWLESARGRLAFVVVLDQFSRNMFRGTGRMFAYDARALEVALEGIDGGVDKRLRHAERQFIYLPLMHSEQLAIQERCVALFTAWLDELAGELRQQVQEGLKFAEQHRDIIRRFGRFPHRNALLGRESTPAELEFLKQPGSSF
ncbi:MAG TPA: DUF924 family protein [Myxococcaceae bacterium]|nr:DUF924 family protein [Myxococcaceae bacterium]